MAAVRRDLGEPWLRVVTDCVDRYPRDSVQALDHVLVMYIIGFVKNYDEGILNSVSEELVDTVDEEAPEKLFADVGRMLAERLVKDRTRILAEASGVSVSDGGAPFELIDCVARENHLANTTGSTDQCVLRSRVAKRC